MKQRTLADVEYSNRKKKTKREEFLETMDLIIPWKELICVIRPYYYNSSKGRPPVDIEVILRMYLLQNWFNLSDEGVEEAIYDSYAMRTFMGINFLESQVPDATTLLHFRHLLEKNDIGKKMFDEINMLLEKNGHIMRGGTIVDASIISAPSSTKNKNKERDPQMHSTKKNNQWFFGMKTHIGVDAGTGYVHSVSNTAANVSDISQTCNLIREDDEVVYGDSGYIGIEKRKEIKEDPQKTNIVYRINIKSGKYRKLKKSIRKLHLEENCQKSRVRSKVEHPFNIVKNIFKFKKVRYKGIKKNSNKLYVLFGLTNIYMCSRNNKKIFAT